MLPRSVTVDVSTRRNRIGNVSEHARAGPAPRGYEHQGGRESHPLRESNSADRVGSTVRPSPSPQEPVAEGVISSNYESTAVSRQTHMMPLSTSHASPLSNAFLGLFGSVPLQLLTIKFLTDIQSLISQQSIRARNRDCFRFSHNRAEFQRFTGEPFRAPPLSTLRIFPVLLFSSFLPWSVFFGQGPSSTLHSTEDFANIPTQFYSTIGSQ